MVRRKRAQFAAVTASVHNHFTHERHSLQPKPLQLNRDAALAEWRQPGAARDGQCPGHSETGSHSSDSTLASYFCAGRDGCEPVHTSLASGRNIVGALHCPHDVEWKDRPGGITLLWRRLESLCAGLGRGPLCWARPP
jgi:hypothetical protein